jgi:MoaA/NifB/PqqE/SkfB family radical SAM enzyme
MSNSTALPTPLCKWPFSHISIDVYGNIRPCCAWELDDQREHQDQYPLFNLNKQSINDYLKSKFYKQVSKDMMDNKWSVGCRDCMFEHKTGVTGTRQAGKKFPFNGKFQLFDMEIKFGNLCNQGCIMCSPMNSSVLEQEAIKHNLFKQIDNASRLDRHLAVQKNSGIVEVPWFDNEERFNEVIEWAAKCHTVKFRGGEPTVNKNLHRFLDKLSTITTDPDIFINTNGHTFTEKLQQVLARFPKVEICLSIDGHGSLNEYIRWPNNWRKLENNVAMMKAMSNVELSVNATVQLMNVGELESLVQWAHDRLGEQLYEFMVNPVHAPYHWQPCLASQERKDKYYAMAEKYQSKYCDLKKILGEVQKNLEPDTHERLYGEAIKQLNIYDKVRNVNWQSVIPKL